MSQTIHLAPYPGDGQAAPPDLDALLLENGDYVLQETADFILLE